MSDLPLPIGATTHPTTVYIEMLDTLDGNYDGRYLRVDSFRQNINRQPVVLSLPRGMELPSPEKAMPQGYSIDFGSMTETIMINGTSLDDDNPSIANYLWLCQLARVGWYSIRPADSNSDTLRIAGGIRLGLLDCGQGQTKYNGTTNSIQQWFQGVISSFNASRDGGQLKWDWQMTLTVSNWPISADGTAVMYRGN